MLYRKENSKKKKEVIINICDLLNTYNKFITSIIILPNVISIVSRFNYSYLYLKF